jgi:anaerobic C4-dicarboxylate transporter
MMKFHFRIALFAATLAVSVQAAGIVTMVPVPFANRAQSTTVEGTFKAYDSINYTVMAEAGQMMTVNVNRRK